MANNKVQYKEIDLPFIIGWCQAHNQIAWLKEAAQQEVEYKVYPRKKVPAVDEITGEPKLTAKGKVKYVSKADKTQEPKVEKKLITFVQLKMQFVERFMPDIMPKAEKKETMYDIIAAL